MKPYRASASFLALGAAFAGCSGDYGESAPDELGGALDHDLVSRPQGAQFDIGAYEFR